MLLGVTSARNLDKLESTAAMINQSAHTVPESMTILSYEK